MKKVGLIFGGPSAEAAVSIMSAKNIARHLDAKKFKLVLIYWHNDFLFYPVKDFGDINKIKKNKGLKISQLNKLFEIAFPITHGRFGEDGVLQSLLESAGIKYVGSRVASSALCMDKAIFKNILASAHIPQTKFITIDFNYQQFPLSRLSRNERGLFYCWGHSSPAKGRINASGNPLDKINITFPIFVKPARSGSSVGISRVEKSASLFKAIKIACQEDKKVIFEQALKNYRELEVAVLGGQKLIISAPGEILPSQKFYTYDDKYKLNKARAIVPAKLPLAVNKKIKLLVEQVYHLGGCEGFARVDLFLVGNKILVNEINTLPGFTDISMFPLLLKDAGLSYQEIITKIINLAY